MVKRKRQNKRSGRPRRGRRIRGRGDYEVDPDIANIVGGIGGGIGSLLGSSDVGRNAALSLHRIFKRVTGYGDYKVTANTLIGGEVPQFMSAERGIRVVHKEAVQGIRSTTGFGIQTYSTNPGDKTVFPWLSNIAKNFQQYRIHGMLFAFESEVLNAIVGINVASGKIILASQYNVYDAAFKNVQEMLNSMYASDEKPQNDILHAIECDPKEKQVTWLNVARGQPVSGQDQRFFTMCKVSLATDGFQSGGNAIGRLHVTYDVEFVKPYVGGNVTDWAHYSLGATTIDSGNPFGTTLPSADADSVTLQTLTANTIVISPSYYGEVMLYWEVSGTGGAAAMPTLTPSGNAVAVNSLLNDTASAVGGVAGGSLATVALTVTCTGGGTITFGAWTPPTGITGGDLSISYLGNEY